MRLVSNLPLLLALPAVVLAGAVVACDSLQGDPASDNPPSPLGSGLRISDVQNPNSSKHAQTNAVVNITSVAVTWLDSFDETKDGKSVGTLYIQDVGSTNPYAGIGVYEPSYVPSDLHAVPGDILDFTGPYQELTSIGTANFSGDVLPQLSKPVGTFRYEYQAPPALVVQLGDLNDYNKGRQWEGMLATVQDVWAQPAQLDTTGFRVTYPLVQQGDAGTAPSNEVSMSNELFDLKANAYSSTAATHFKSITGIVTWFFNFHIAPRTPDDIVQ
jgi:hypothetical protein